jgi:hypothetical protein
MKLLREVLLCCLIACLISLAICGILLTRATTAAEYATPIELANTRIALVAQVQAARVDALKEIDKQADGLRAELHGDVRLVNAQVSAITGQLNQRTGDALRRIDTALQDVTPVLARTSTLLSDADVVVISARPVLANTAALVKDAQDSWDDSYDDVRSLLDSAEVTTTQAAQTLETINKATPDQLAAAQKTATAVAGITTDVHTATTAMLKPKSFFGKVWAGLTVASRFAGIL